MPVRTSLRSLAVVGALAGMLGCGGSSTPRSPSRTTTAGAQADAEYLARDLFDIVDRVMSYRSSHQGMLPPSLSIAGIDSLTPQTVRRLEAQGNSPLVTVAFRREGTREVVSCRGTNLLLEEAMLNSGEFPVECTLAAGGDSLFRVGKKAE